MKPGLVGLLVGLLVVLLAVRPGGPAVAGQDPPAARILHRMQARADRLRSVEAGFLLTRADPRFLRCFFTPSELNLEGVLAFSRPDDFDLHLRQEGNCWYRFDSRQGSGLRFSALVRLGAGSAAFPSPPQSTADPDLGLADFNQDSADLHPFHPLCLLWPPELWKDIPQHEAHVDGTETLFDRVCFRLRIPIENGGRLGLWVDRETFEARRVEVVPQGAGAVLLAEYRRERPDDPCWSEVEVQADYRPLFRARSSAIVVDPARSRLPELTLVLHRPGGVSAREGPSRPLLSPVFRGVLWALVALLAVLGGRLVYQVFRRRSLARELILLDAPGGDWQRRLRGLGFPVEAFTPEVVTRELQGLDRGRILATSQGPRALVVAPEACAGARAHRYLLKAFVEEGGRVLLLSHRDPRSWPFQADAVEMAAADVRGINFESPGPWRGLEARKVAWLAQALGCGVYPSGLDGRPFERELVGFRGGDGAQATVLGVAHRGRGEWWVCQLNLPDPGPHRRDEAGRLLRELLELLQGRPEAGG